VYGREGLARFRSEVLLPGSRAGCGCRCTTRRTWCECSVAHQRPREFRRYARSPGFSRRRRLRTSSPPGTRIRIQATDLYHRVPFPFFPPLFSVLCSDLSRYSVADAVAASMRAVLFAPVVVVRTFPESCEPSPRKSPRFAPDRKPRGSSIRSQRPSQPTATHAHRVHQARRRASPTISRYHPGISRLGTAPPTRR